MRLCLELSWAKGEIHRRVSQARGREFAGLTKTGLRRREDALRKMRKGMVKKQSREISN